MSVQMGTVDRSYLLQEQLGEGAMGTVYRATQLVNGQAVALKLVPRQLASGDALSEDLEVQYRLALAREFQTLASLHHPNVIRVLNYGFDQTYGPYYIMELLEAPLTPLEASLGQSDEGRIRLIAQLLRALSYIHQRGVIHRDIKPSNVLVVGGELKLLDFGISVDKFEKAEFAGTAEYMAPELLRGGQPSISSDLYAVGLLLHHMLTGSLPSNTPSMGRVLQSLLDEEAGAPGELGEDAAAASELDAMNDRLADLLDDDLDGGPEPPPPALEQAPEIPTLLRPILTKLLAPQISDRYANANDVLRDLSAAVTFELPVETVATRESFLRATMLVGRDAELSALKLAIENTRHGTGSAFLVGGESGVGKSRLIAELRTLALVYGAWVAEGQSVSEGGYYYQEWLPLLRALCFRVDMNDDEASVLKGLIPNVGQMLGRDVPDPPAAKPEEVQALIVSSIVGLIKRLTKPLVLVLEDLHWARSESLSLLKQLVQQVDQLPILIIGTFRSDESRQLPENLAGMRLIQLSRLDAPQIGQLSESILGTIGRRPELVAYLTRQTEGNAFFLVEIVRALAEDAGELTRIGQGELPEAVLTVGIERIVERRIDHLPRAFHPWIEFAATLGRRLDPPVLERAFPSLPLRTFLIECANAAVLESQGSDWRFAHDKLRETILRRLDETKRNQLHKQVAEAIESTYKEGSRESQDAALAYHFREAGILDKALRYYLQAADTAARLFLYEEARSHYAGAKETLEKCPDTPELRSLHIDILLKQVHTGLTNEASQTQLRRLAKARTLLEGLANTSAATAADRLRMARVDYYSGRAYYYSGQPKEAIRHYERVIPIAKEFGDQELMVMPAYVIGLALCTQGQFGRASAMLGETIEPMVQHVGIALDTIRCALYHAIALGGAGRCQQARASIERARKWADQFDQPLYQIVFATLHALATLVTADWPSTVTLSERILELSTKAGETVGLYVALDFMAWSESYLGRYEQAAEHRARSTVIRQDIGGGIMRDWFEAAEAEILLNSGRTEEALQQAKKVAASSRVAELPFSQAVAERAWGCALIRLGSSFEEAEEHFQTSLDICRGTEQVTNAAQTELWWGRMCRERGDESKAQLHFAEARRLAESGGNYFELAEVCRIMTSA